MQKHREFIYWERSAKEEILEVKSADSELVQSYYNDK